MAREFEIKLEIPPSTVSKVMRLPWLWELAIGELQATHMVSTYYDTPGLALRQRGITLRVRRIGSTCLQTIKTAVNGAAVPIERHEWEEEIVSSEPELQLAAGTPLERVSRKKLRGLQSHFEVHVDRSAFPIQSANSAIEVAIDRTHISGAGKDASFCEVELELKRGASSELARIARRIASEVPASIVLRTKADRGFALRDGETPKPQHAEAVGIGRAARVGESFQAIGWSCLRHFALNADVIANDDTQGVHQMRVGLRRLRAAIAVFKHLLDGPETDAIKAELKWLTDELGPARELDVFLEETLVPLRAAQADQAALTALCDDVAARRKAALERVKAVLASDRYRQLALRTALWLIASEWSDTAEADYEQPSRRVGVFANNTLSKRMRKIVRKLDEFEDLPHPEQHKLRIAVKKLRYATEFFDDIFHGHGRGPFLRTLEDLQEDLGRLNDIAVQERLRDEFMQSWTEQTDADPKNIQKAFAMGFAIGQQQQERDERVAAVKKERHDLSEIAPFWD